MKTILMGLFINPRNPCCLTSITNLRISIGLLFCTLFSCIAHATELLDYVQQCQTELQFNAADIKPQDCNKGFRFAGGVPPGLINDFVGYSRVNEKVDLVFACRWLRDMTEYSTRAESVELIIHNRENGKTCFFASKPGSGGNPDSFFSISTAIVSPTNFSTQHPNADDYWFQPTELNAAELPTSQLPGEVVNKTMESFRCVGCHVAGPYIASANIAPFLANFGLLNDGHDTYVRRYHVVGSNPPNNNNNNPSAFKNWNTIVANNNVQELCSSSCHSIGSNSRVISLNDKSDSEPLIPSLQINIKEIADAGLMPADLDFDTSNVYRWVNMDTPTNDAGEYETLARLEQEYPRFYCDTPSALEAHVVGAGSDAVFQNNYRSLFPDNLRYIDMRNGVKCFNEEQPLLANGQHRTCRDYQISFQCSDFTWTEFYNKDRPNDGGKGDFENASKITNLCNGTPPLAMQVKTKLSSGASITSVVPNDRLNQLDNKNLICLNSQQGAGNSCSNYVVRFACSSITPPSPPRTIVRHENANNIGTGKVIYVVSENINGWTAWNMNGRQVYVNGVLVNLNQIPLPPKTMDGKYYFTFTAGSSRTAGWTFW